MNRLKYLIINKNMEPEEYIHALKKTYVSYLQKFKGRKNLYNRATIVIVNIKSQTKKLCLAITREIFEDENNVCCLFLNDKELSSKLMELLKKGFEEDIEFDEFKNKFFGLSETFEFIFKLSEYYCFLVKKINEEYYEEYIPLFLFEKKFKDKYLNILLDSVGIEKVQITFKNFIEKIKNNKFDDKNKTFDELKKIFSAPSKKYEHILSEKKDGSLIENNEAKKVISNQKNEQEIKKASEIPKNGGNELTKKIINKSKNDIKTNDINNSKNETLLKNINDTNSTKFRLNINQIPEENNFLINQINKEINYNIIDEQINSRDDNNIINYQRQNNIEINPDQYTVFDYLKNKYRKYKKSAFIPVLNDKIYSKLSFSLKDIGCYNKNLFAPLNELNDITLSELIEEKLNIQEKMENENEYGYFCYHYNKRVIEGLYSIIDRLTLYNYSNEESQGDDYCHPNIITQNLAIKRRAMTLEYFINYPVFFEKYKVKHYPRIIYPLKNENNNLDKELLNEIKIDGAFFVENAFKIEDKDFPFIFQHFLSFNNSNKLYKCNKSKFKSDLSGKEFKKNDLCFLEIKTNFPETQNYEQDFPNILTKMLEKMIIFEQLFRELGVNYERIRLILFYDLIKRINFGNVIEKILEKFARDNAYLDYIDKICFQVIYVNSYYLVESLISNAEKWNIIDMEIKDIKKGIKKRAENISKVELENNKLQIENNKLLKMINSQKKELENMKKEMLKSIHNLEIKFSLFEEKLNSIPTLNEKDSSLKNMKAKNNLEDKHQLI